MKKIFISLAVLLLCSSAYAQDVMPSPNDIVFVTAQCKSSVQCYTIGADENLTFETVCRSTFESHGLTGIVETYISSRQDTCSVYGKIFIFTKGTQMQTVAWRTDLPSGMEVQKVDVRAHLTVIGAQGQLSESIESLVSPSLSFVFPNKYAGKGDQKSEFGAEFSCNITGTSPSQWQALCKAEWVPYGLLILLLDGKVFCVSLPGESTEANIPLTKNN